MYMYYVLDQNDDISQFITIPKPDMASFSLAMILAMVFGDFWPGTHRQPVLAAHITEPRRKRFGPHIPRSPGNLPRAGRSGSYRNQGDFMEFQWFI